jgi:predicted nucleic acid-binding protein
VIYLDTSVALAHLLAEDRRPPDELWSELLVSSRLIEYELWIRLRARGLAESHGPAARALLAHLAILELTSNVLARVLEPFPGSVRTLDALHLASADFLRGQKQTVEIASYDDRMSAAARKMGFSISRYCAEL